MRKHSQCKLLASVNINVYCPPFGYASVTVFCRTTFLAAIDTGTRSIVQYSFLSCLLLITLLMRRVLVRTV